MATDMPTVDWSAVTEDGFAFAEIVIPPFDRLDVHELNLSFYYTGDTTGLIRLYRRLDGEGCRGTWILHTDMSGELSSADDDKWVIRMIKEPEGR